MIYPAGWLPKTLFEYTHCFTLLWLYDFGVEFTKTDREKVFKIYDQTGVELLVGKKMFLQK